MRKKSGDDLSAEFITTIKRDNDATNIGTNDATNSGANNLTINADGTTNIGTSGNSVATDHLVDEYFSSFPACFN